jgi:hypothetical protein
MRLSYKNWLCYVALHARCSTVSLASDRTSQKTASIIQTLYSASQLTSQRTVSLYYINHSNLGVTTLASKAIGGWLIHSQTQRYYTGQIIIIIITIIIINLFCHIPATALQSNITFCPKVTGKVGTGFSRIKSQKLKQISNELCVTNRHDMFRFKICWSHPHSHSNKMTAT